MNPLIQELTTGLLPTMAEDRRFLHSCPEPSFREIETQQFVISRLESLGIPCQWTERHRAVVGRIKGDKPGKTIAFRADMDALEIQEENDTPYRSRNDGFMHACGHDGHTAVLLALARALSERRELIRGEVRFLFQHAEENPPGGAVDLIEDGALQGVDLIFGAHLWMGNRLGEVALREGPLMACSDRFRVDLSGRGGHGGEPHKNLDALQAAATIATQLQTVVSRWVGPTLPAVLSVCQLHAGSAYNIMPDTAMLEGTVRAFDEVVRDLAEERIRQISQGISAAYGVSCAAEYFRGYPPLVNDPAVTARLAETLRRDMDCRIVTAEQTMGGEDFAYYLRTVPGTYFFVGARDESRGFVYPHHHPRFDFPEEAMAVMLGCFLSAYLGEMGQSN